MLAALCFATAPATFAAQSSSAFARAERLHEALEGRPEQQRTRLQYEHVLDAYRAIYHGDPGSPKADASIAAVADLLAEEGRVFEDQKALRDAIGQYEFLRHQYPGTRFRFSALLTEAEIYQRDLGDLTHAKAAYQNFLHLYPQNALAVEARAQLKNIHREEIAARHHRSSSSRTTAESGESSPPSSHAASGTREHRGSAIAERDNTGESPAAPADAQPVSASDTRLLNAPPPPRRGGLPYITGVRHWSTPTYTRVAIDLQQQVRYEAARVTSPDRIFFDLYGTRLSPELSGRPVEITGDPFLTRVRAAQTSPNTTRVVLDVTSVADYSAFFLQNPPRLIIDVHGNPNPPRPIAAATPPENPSSSGVRAAPVRTPSISERPLPPLPNTSAGGNESGSASDSDNGSALTDVSKLSRQPGQVRATRHPTTAPVVASVPAAAPSSRSASRRDQVEPSSNDDDDVPPAEAGAGGTPATESATRHAPNSMVRALGLKINRIVIDAGHGGHDSGTLGPGGLQEKDIVLDVALRLGRLLQQRIGADVTYTRSDDTFIPLETRTAIANQAQADLFISIHANSSPDSDARGVEVYYLSFTSSADALEVAARENATSDESIHQLSDLVKKIALQDKINESRAFADDVDSSLYAGLDQGNPGLKDRGVKKAPFVVLIGANMPSILAEISFLTNPDDARELRQPKYRQRIAEALYRGVSRYVSSLNGVRVAQAGTHPSSSE
ncbi:MAG TPA: N-acetylmuramoyl-L-alanine amidase [Acidobacteriaceae bacterium]|nr:N-acetylmuramoyl-L-alanine amidase [Acidobacteriaceae bacterium]